MDSPLKIVKCSVSDDFFEDPGRDEVGQPVFHAAYDKARWINGILARLAARRNWIALIDDDVLLSGELEAFWRESAQNLVSEALLYGAAGRSLQTTCATLPLDGVSEAYLQTHRSVVGYFNLFWCSENGPWYPPSDPRRIEHDDWRFYRLFGPEKCRVLPLAVGHIGKPGSRNWAGRADPLGGRHSEETSAQDPLTVLAPPEPSSAVECLGKGRDTVLVAGTVGVEVLEGWGAEYKRVLWHPGSDFEYTSGPNARFFPDGMFIHPGPDAELLRLAREWKLGEMTKRRPEKPGWVARAGGSWPEGMPGKTVPAETVELDAILLWGEVSLSWLLEELPRWLPRLKPEGDVWLTRCGPEKHPNWTQVVALVLGPVERVPGRQLWRRVARGPQVPAAGAAEREIWPRCAPFARVQRYWHLGPDIQAPRRFFVRGAEESPTPAEGVFFYHRGLETEDLILSLHALRTAEPGRFIGVVHEGPDAISLRIACARYEVDYFCVEETEPVEKTELSWGPLVTKENLEQMRRE